MDFLYRLFIYIHVLSATASVGPFFILFPLIKKMKTAVQPELGAYLNSFQFIVRLAKHAGHVLVISGVLLVIMGPWTWQTPWILMTLFVMFLSLFFLARAFTPKLRKFEDEKVDKAVLAAQLRKTTWTYITLLAAMLWFMVVKPSLW